MKATWTPGGAGGLPAVKPLLLPEMPELPEKAHAEPVGSYWNLPAPTSVLLETRVTDRGRVDRCRGDLVDEGGVVSTGPVQSLEFDRVRPGGDGERGGGVALVSVPDGVKVPTTLPSISTSKVSWDARSFLAARRRR